jgi:hypothetical protein
METILLTDNQITESTLLGGNIDVDRYKFCIIDAQISKLEESLGETLYEKIKTDFENGDLTGDYLILHTKYITPFLIHQSAMEYLKIGAYHVSNGGIYKHTPNNGTAIDKNEVDFLVENQRVKAEMYMQRMEKWLSLNRIPEYYSYVSGTVVPARKQSTGSWFFEGINHSNKRNKSDNDNDQDFGF